MLFVCIFCPSLCVSFFNIRQFQGAQEKAPNNSKVVFLSAQARNRSLKFVSLRIILLILIISLFSKLNRGSKQSVYPHVPSIKQIHFSFVFVFLHAALSPFFFNLPFLILSRSQQTAHTQLSFTKTQAKFSQINRQLCIYIHMQHEFVSEKLLVRMKKE